MAIWLPEPLYRLFPWLSVGAGLFFFAFVQGFVSVLLCGALIGYGLGARLRRAVG